MVLPLHAQQPQTQTQVQIQLQERKQERNQGTPRPGPRHKTTMPKNAALPILCAAILTPDTLQVENVPHLRDVTTALSLLAQMGVEVSLDEMKWAAKQSGKRIEAKSTADILKPGDVVYVAPKDPGNIQGAWSLMQIPEVGGGPSWAALTN